MAKNPQEVVFEGWLTKSPPTKRIWRARWRRRWFLLTHSGELPGQYILTYYTDRNCRKLKGIIDLDHCEQVDLGLKLDERKLKFDYVFDIKTPTRTYYLAADTENEMKAWVNCICKVCGLKSTSEEDEDPFSARISHGPDVEITEEAPEDHKPLNNFSDTPPISPVSNSPYIPISECITGKSPVFDPKDFKTLIEYNRKNNVFKSEQHTNESYEFPPKNSLNYMNLQDPRFYDCPRKLGAPSGHRQDVTTTEKNHSPLQSPTDSDSVFNDEEWVHNSSTELDTLRNTRPSDSSADENIVATQKFTKVTSSSVPPPRPPKPTQKIGPSYLNLSTKGNKENGEGEKPNKENQLQNQTVLSDDMYDFPRSHQIENDGTGRRKHCYSNAAPVPYVEGNVFRYDVSPKPGTSNTVFRYDMDDASQNFEPPSPAHSQSSSTPAYSNLPSPLLTYTTLMPPPVVNRELKPKRKLSSDSHSISSNPEPSSPRNAVTAPSVDRKLKPPTPLQEAHMRKTFTTDEDQHHRRQRAAPSPTPQSLGRSHDSLLVQTENEDIYRYLTGKMQYLDLDLESPSSNYNSGDKKSPPVKAQRDTVYKQVDFMKTMALNITKEWLDKNRHEQEERSKKK